VQQGVPDALLGDPTRLRQVLTNLVGNALKFTDRGGAIVEVTLLEDTASAVTLRLAVRDTGIGIPSTVQKTLFQSFTQADTSTTRRYGGTGLGLAICKRLVELMGGEIALESEVGGGSTFWFTVTLPKQSSQPAPREYHLKGYRLLVADDFSASQEAIAAAASQFGMSVQAVELSQTFAALRQAQSAASPYPLVLVSLSGTDWEDGQFLQDLRSVAPSSDTRCLAIAAASRHIFLKSLIDRDVIDGYLTKPLKLSRLPAELDTLLHPDAIRPQAVIPSVPPVTLPPHLTQAHLLVAEDNAINRKVTLKQLESLGIQADAVADGQAVLTYIAGHDCDLILMDCQMPVLDGYETTQILRQQEGISRHTIVIAMTASALPEDRDRCFAAGMDDFISKPVRKEELLLVLERWLSQLLLAPASPESRESPARADSPIDLVRLQELSEGDIDFERELLTEFVALAKDSLATLREARALADRNTLRRQAHQLKGASGNVGASAIQALAAQLEAEKESTDELEEVMDRMSDAIAKVQEFLQDMSA
jgi:CheY-like chemotaxis protein/HPt (histidine-containing phosphotransfer) domain-containing protein